MVDGAYSCQWIPRWIEPVPAWPRLSDQGGGGQGGQIFVANGPHATGPIAQFSPPVHGGVGCGACDRLVHAVSPDAPQSPPIRDGEKLS